MHLLGPWSWAHFLYMTKKENTPLGAWTCTLACVLVYYDCSPKSRFRLSTAGLPAVSCNFVATWCNLIWLSSFLVKTDEIRGALNFIRKSFHDFLGNNHIID